MLIVPEWGFISNDYERCVDFNVNSSDDNFFNSNICCHDDSHLYLFLYSGFGYHFTHAVNILVDTTFNVKSYLYDAVDCYISNDN